MTSRKQSAARRFLQSYFGRIVVALMLIAIIQLFVLSQFVLSYQREQTIARKIKSLHGRVEWIDMGPDWIPRTIKSKTRLSYRLAGIVVYRRTEIPVELLDEIATLGCLERLYIGDRPLEDSALVHLRGLTSLQELQIHSSKVTDAGLEHLKNLKSLRKLWLGSTQVGDRGMEHLRGLTNLEKLVLDHTQVTDVGLDKLKDLTKLRDVDLEITTTTEEGRKLLRKALPNCVVNPNP